MTKNQIHKRSSRSDKEHPGCMGGILSLFDFNQSLAGRKLLTDKRHADRTEIPSMGLDLSISNKSLETPKSRDVKIEHARHVYEMRKSSPTKKKGGLPMKALIAEEMSKELETKRRTPSVVARLMGLDALPSESMLTDHIEASENYPQNNMHGKRQHLPKPPRDAWFFSQKSRVSASKPAQKLPLPTSQQQIIDYRDWRIPPEKFSSREHPQEKQLQEFKKEFGASQASKIDYAKIPQLDELNMQLVEKHMLVHEKLDEAKMALVRQKFIDAKHLATDEKLQRSKEFLDALEVLQSNKDLFLKFLEEPNSLFAKHLRDLQSTSQPASQTKKSPKMKSSNASTTHEVLKEEDVHQGRCSKEGKKHEKRHQKQRGPRCLAEREEEWRVRSSSPGTSAEGKNDICSLPTRIVVLKPGPGGTQNVLPTPSPSYSPQSQTALKNLGEIERANTRDFLQEVRERLKLGISENRKDDSRITQESIREQIHDGPKDPREIAREIARQVRESVTRDLSNDLPRLGEVSTSFSSFAGKRNSLNKSRNSSVDTVSSDTEVSTPVTKHSLDDAKRFGCPPSYFQGKSLHSSESNVNREAKKRLSERLRLTHGDEEEQPSVQNSSTLGKMLALPEDKKYVFQSNGPEENNKVSMGIEDIQLLPCRILELDSKNKSLVRHEMATDCRASLDHKIGDENGDISPGNLLRSRSVPVSAANFGINTVVMQSKMSDISMDNAHEMVPDMSSIGLPTELIKRKNDRSIFKGKVSSLKGSFLLRGRRSSHKKSDYLNPLQPNISIPLHVDDVCESLQEVPVELEECKERPRALVICDPPQEMPVEPQECKERLGDLVICDSQKEASVDPEECKEMQEMPVELQECKEKLGDLMICDSQKEASVDPEECKERPGNLVGPEYEESCMQPIDAPDNKTELPKLSEECKERPGDLVGLEEEETCMQLTDTLNMRTELFGFSLDTRSEMSPVEDTGSDEPLLEALDCTADSIQGDTLQSFVDDKGSEGSLLEALDCAPSSVQSDLLRSGADIEYMTQAILPEQPQPSSPTSYSAEKSLAPNESSAPENNNEKTEQPSPVSVLDSPFPEEISSPKDFKQISSNLQDLRLQLRLLRFDGSENPKHQSEDLLQGDSLVLEDHDIGEVDIFSENTCHSPSETEVSPTSRFPSSVIENEDFESIEVDDISCPKEKKPDLLYVRNILVASGFTGDGIFARWHLPNHPLDPLLFEKMENLHGYGVQHETKNSSNELAKTGACASKLERHLLFDCINEVLLELLGPFFNYHPWVQETKLNLRPIPAGKQLLKETWTAISYYLYKQSQTRDTLESIVAKDLAREGVWMDLRNDVESVGREVEGIIFNDLIEEAVFDFVS